MINEILSEKKARFPPGRGRQQSSRMPCALRSKPEGPPRPGRKKLTKTKVKVIHCHGHAFQIQWIHWSALHMTSNWKQSHLCILGLGRILHCILEQVVLLAQLHALTPSVNHFMLEYSFQNIKKQTHLLLPLYRYAAMRLNSISSCFSNVCASWMLSKLSNASMLVFRPW